MTTIVRFALTAALLVVVWRHAHWSVALSITLLTVAVEVSQWVTKRELTFRGKP